MCETFTAKFYAEFMCRPTKKCVWNGFIYKK